MHVPPVLWAWIRAPATHFLGARILTTLTISTSPAAVSALPQHLPSPFSVSVLSSQYLFQRGPIWVTVTEKKTLQKNIYDSLSRLDERVLGHNILSHVSILERQRKYVVTSGIGDIRFHAII